MTERGDLESILENVGENSFSGWYFLGPIPREEEEEAEKNSDKTDYTTWQNCRIGQKVESSVLFSTESDACVLRALLQCILDISLSLGWVAELSMPSSNLAFEFRGGRTLDLITENCSAS